MIFVGSNRAICNESTEICLVHFDFGIADFAVLHIGRELVPFLGRWSKSKSN